MKTITVLLLIFSINLTFSQKNITANDYEKNFDGTYVTILKNDGFAIVDTSGTIISNKIKFKAYDQNIKSLIIYKGVTFQFDKETQLYRLIDLQMNPITKYLFKSIKPFITDNTWALTKDDKEVYLDYKGNIICTYNKQEIEKQLGRTGLASTMKVIGSGSKKVDLFYDDLLKYSDSKSKKIGFLNTDNQFVITPEYDKASDFSEGLVAVSKFEPYKFIWGFVNANNQVKIPFKFSNQPGDFHSKRASVFSKKRKYGFIDETGNIVIEAKYYKVSNFYKGFAIVKETYNSKTTLIDLNGKVINDFGSDLEIEINQENLKSLVDEQLTIANVKRDLRKKILDKRSVIINSKGEILCKRFNEISNLVNGKALAKIKDEQGNIEKGLINIKGEFIFKIVASEF